VLSGLLIRSPWIDRILDGSKTWEIRGSRTSKRGRIALIKSGTGTVIGVAGLVEVVGPLELPEFVANAHKTALLHSEAIRSLPYKRTFAWVLENPRRLIQPIPYVHPYGSIVWVKLEPTVERASLSATSRESCSTLA
jgi:hypothetical protein